MSPRCLAPRADFPMITPGSSTVNIDPSVFMFRIYGSRHGGKIRPRPAIPCRCPDADGRRAVPALSRRPRDTTLDPPTGCGRSPPALPLSARFVLTERRAASQAAGDQLPDLCPKNDPRGSVPGRKTSCESSRSISASGRPGPETLLAGPPGLLRDGRASSSHHRDRKDSSHASRFHPRSGEARERPGRSEALATRPARRVWWFRWSRCPSRWASPWRRAHRRSAA